VVVDGCWRLSEDVGRCRYSCITVWHTWLHLVTLGHTCLRLPSLDAAWTRLNIPVKAPITLQYQSSWAVLLSGASAHRCALAFLIKSAETLRAQPIPLFFVRLLVGPNWHRGATLTALNCTCLRLPTLGSRYRVSTTAARHTCLRLDIDIVFRPALP
jgi:hypothetical protein